ncbi:MAG: hypothetical protein WAZ63_16295, partial [Rhodoferax sp.]
FFGQRGFTRVGVRNDGKSTAAPGFVEKGHGGVSGSSLQVSGYVSRLVQHANDVDVFRAGKVKHRIWEMVQGPESKWRFDIGQGVAHGTGGRMALGVVERLGNCVSKAFRNLQVCNIKIVIKRPLQVVGRLGK